MRSVPCIHTSHIATMLLEVHTTFCVQIGGKSRVACERVVSRGQSSFGRYEHFAHWSGRYEHFRPLKRAVWTIRPILTPRHNWLHAALRASMQCDFFRPFGHKNYNVCVLSILFSFKWHSIASTFYNFLKKYSINYSVLQSILHWEKMLLNLYSISAEMACLSLI